MGGPDALLGDTVSDFPTLRAIQSMGYQLMLEPLDSSTVANAFGELAQICDEMDRCSYFDSVDDAESTEIAAFSSADTCLVGFNRKLASDSRALCLLLEGRFYSQALGLGRGLLDALDWSALFGADATDWSRVGRVYRFLDARNSTKWEIDKLELVREELKGLRDDGVRHVIRMHQRRSSGARPSGSRSLKPIFKRESTLLQSTLWRLLRRRGRRSSGAAICPGRQN